MDNYLKENRNGIKYKEILFLFLVDWIWRGNLAIPSLRKAPLFMSCSVNARCALALHDRFFSLKGETLNLWGLIINYQLSIIHCKVGFWLLR